MTTPPIMHQPTPVETAGSQLTAFMRVAARSTGRAFPDQSALYRWSVSDYRAFWRLVLEWSDLPHEGERTPVCQGDSVADATFFPAVRLNYAECLLEPPGYATDGRAVGVCHEDEDPVWITRATLRDRVRRVANGLARLGVRAGDHVVAIARNDDAAIIACLATAALGATWSSVGPDLAPDAVLRRFAQLNPIVLLAHSGERRGGRYTSLVDRVGAVVSGLPGLQAVVALDEVETVPGASATLADLARSTPIDGWTRFPFNQPLFVLFSSGTTGPPKAMVHGAGGTLLEHVKEHRLHGDMRAEDRLFYYTSCGWMMWNWQLSALATGGTIITYDGSASQPAPDQLWRLIADAGATIFGTSPAYLQYCRSAGIVPRDLLDGVPLRAVLSTGSILFDPLYDWVRDQVAPVPLQSISGGTDIVGCFVLGSPNLPVYRGESSCVSLGLDVQAWDGDRGLTVGRGELTCASPFPSRPLGLVGDPDGTRFHQAYFDAHPGRWTHGDQVELTAHGTARILGRSDGVMNIKGIRIGPAELYAVIEDFAEFREALAVEQRAPAEPGGSRLVLLVVMAEGVELDRPLTLRLKKALKDRASGTHVPAVIASVSALPMTLNGKRSEQSARDALDGRPVRNLTALANPEVLAELSAHPELQVHSAG